ncbi:MAG: aconitate hydratase AcnA [Flavobacteriaceae bacterium]
MDLVRLLDGRARPLPFCLRIVLENLVRNADPEGERTALAGEVATWSANSGALAVPLAVSRIIMPDSSGLPALLDLAAAREMLVAKGLPPSVVEPVIPVDLVIDHSLIVDEAGTPGAEAHNIAQEYRRNGERYAFFKWAEQAFEQLRVAAPGMGIIHQIHLEKLARLIAVHRDAEGREWIAPEFVLGCDSHTPMINGLGLLGWGVGGIDAEAAMLGQPYFVRIPRVVGVRLLNALPAGATSTDLVLTVTERLRQVGVVGDFVEFFGPGLPALSVPDRATISNMAPEYGATVGYFPIDARTIDYLRQSGREEAHIELVERYARAAGLFAEGGEEPEYSEVVEIDLAAVSPSVAGPKRPQDRHRLSDLAASFRAALTAPVNEGGFGLEGDAAARQASVETGGAAHTLTHGSVVIAAITSCTNTSNPSVMIGAGLLARNAVARGLAVAPGVKTSLAPGSRLVGEYLANAGLMTPLEALGFHIVGYGCTTCSGKSGPIEPRIADAIQREGLVAVSVLSGNRNFEGRIHKSARAAYLASPPLVIAFALAGRIDIDFETEPLGLATGGEPVFLRDIWPDGAEIAGLVRDSQMPEAFRRSYSTLFDGTRLWRELPASSGALFGWDEASEYIRRPPFFDDPEASVPDRLQGARALCVFGDSLTTDHVTPSGEILPDSLAGRYLLSKGVAQNDFNAVTQRRGNHEVMARVTFANQRLKNRLAGGVEGGWTRMEPDGDVVAIHDAATRFREAGVPTIVIAGRDYGMGSSRDWAAKGPKLLGVRAVLAVSFERIHRANLIGMGIVPLVFAEGEDAGSLGLDGFESFEIAGIHEAIRSGGEVAVTAIRRDARAIRFAARVDLASGSERELLMRGGIFPAVLEEMTARARRMRSDDGAVS